MVIKTDISHPILFRTTIAEVFDKTLNNGEIWLRSDQYYRELEDKIRNDEAEGLNSSRTKIPLHVDMGNGGKFIIKGEGHVGQFIVPHYIFSMHGTSISQEQFRDFGGHTFGIKNIMRLAADILYQTTKQIECNGYRYGPVSYRYTSLGLFHNAAGGAAVAIGNNPTLYLNPIESDVLIKRPIPPFIDQDEWRIAIFTNGYLNNDPAEPIKIFVNPENFFDYRIKIIESGEATAPSLPS